MRISDWSSDVCSSDLQDGRRWADDVAAVIERLDLKRPVLVGWSFGGRVLCDYVRHHGQDGIAGLVYVGAATNMNPAHAGPGRASIPDMFSDELAPRIDGTRRFLRACPAAPMPADRSDDRRVGHECVCTGE